jgi:RNA polymerase I-specific transcription initiation factor RRN3
MRSRRDEDYKKDMYLAFVNNALQQKMNVSVLQPSLFHCGFDPSTSSQGIGEPFDELVEQFNIRKNAKDRGYSSAQLRLFLLALSYVVSRLERHHSPLVEAIVNMPWATMDHAFVKSYTVFIGMLLSARPEYLSLVLSRISKGFTYRQSL